MVAVATAHVAWAKASSAGRVTGVEAFDLTAAFDTVDYKVLCHKLKALGITSPMLAWFHNYLVGRTQGSATLTHFLPQLKCIMRYHSIMVSHSGVDVWIVQW